jgi:hypothetical protein
MSYQIPSQAAALILRGDTTVPLFQFTPTELVRIKKLIATMIICGLDAQLFKMKINVYLDSGAQRLLFSSDEVLGTDIERGSQRYCELRFDFPSAGNLITIGHKYFVEFEILDYTPDEENYVGLIVDHDSPLAILCEGTAAIPIRCSAFYERA